MWLSLFLFLIFLPIFAVACVYTAATRTRTLTNISIVLLRALLKLQKVIESSDGCAVEPCPGGIVLKDVAVPNNLLELKSGSVTVKSIYIKRLHLLWATSSSPFTLCITGVTISVLQRRVAPKVLPNSRPVQSHTSKLNALEALLWGGRQPSGIFGWRWRQLQLLRFMIALALRNISVFVADAEFQYQQTGNPGPVVKPSGGSAVDAVTVTIRTIEVSPKSNPSSDVPAVAGQPSPESSTDATGQNPLVGSDVRTLTGPPPEVRRWLYSWRDVSGLFPRIQALYNWFDRLVLKYHPVEDCNAARICVAGVNVLLMSQPSNPVTNATQQQQEQRQQTSSRLSGSKRLRDRSGIPGRVSSVLAKVLVATTKGKLPVAARPVPEWAYVATVLRQWSMQVDVSLGSQPALGSSRKRPTACLGQSLALHFKGTFGFRGQQRSADNLSREAHNPARSSTSSFLSRTEAPDAQTSANPQGMSRRTIQPSNLSRSSRTAAAQHSPSLQPSSNGCTQEATTAQNSGRGAIGAGAGLVIHVDVILKALVLELGPEGVAQVLRMVDRVLTYEKYSVHWSRRPAVSITQSPAAWWQHAGHAIINDCREHFPLRKVRDMMARRAEYIRVYKELHSMQRGFCAVTYLPEYETSEKYKDIVPKLFAGAAAPDASRRYAGDASSTSPAGSAGIQRTSSGGGCSPNDLRSGPAPVLNKGRRRFPMKEVLYPRAQQEPSRSAQLVNRLIQLEAQLPLGQIMCNRTFVALWHSDWLARSHDTKARWLEAMDVITNFVDAIPTMDEEEEEPSNSVAVGEDGTDVAHSRKSVDPISGRIQRAPAATQISLAIDCPRLGLKLINKQCLSSTVVGLQGAKDKPAVASEVTKVPADVLAIMLEGIHFSMPDIYRIDLQAASVKISLLGGVSGGPKHVLIVPASHECADGHGTKLDFSTIDKSHIAKGSATAENSFQGAVNSWASEGSIYPDAPISRYLSRFKVHLAAVEIALSSPPFVVACARFMDSVMRFKAATRKAGVATPYEWPSTN
ncbi:hypothetical protein Vafri_2897, partial [Volvox africanus]